MFDEARMLLRFAGGLRDFFAQPPSAAEARQLLSASLNCRSDSFLRLLEYAVYPIEDSPYRWLLQRARLNLNDVRRMVASRGLEPALGDLLEAGVYLTLDEFKGRIPIRRGQDTFEMAPAACDNPVLEGHFEASTGGSSGKGRRLVIDLDLLRHESAGHLLFTMAAGLLNAPLALWRTVPPGTAGLKRALAQSRLRLPFDRWFTPLPYHLLRPDSKSWAITTASLAVSRFTPVPVPVPEFVPLDDPGRVANWMAGLRRGGKTAYLDAPVSSAVMAASAALAGRLDISGSFVRTGGEPLTPARSDVLREAGCRVSSHYAISETGPIGLSCCDSVHADDCHLMEDKVALLARGGVHGVRAPSEVEPLFLTTVLGLTPKIMINVETGDTAVREVRPCGCIFGELGFHTHLHTIRSYEKLNTGGMHFLGSALMRVIEEVLPPRFGGSPTDYQFVESDAGGQALVHLHVHPRLGAIDEALAVDMVLSELSRGGVPDRMMAGQWRQGNILRIKRAAPKPTSTAKILPVRFN